MNIVLLSGGSGRRLWPLSSDMRPKQYLQVLKSPEGTMESMVQRVLRQIKESGVAESILLAAGAVQRDCIESQVSNAAEVVYEPDHRDTFPAIALAAAYLALEKGRDLDQVVLVMPVDPFCDLAYFHALKRMEDAVKDGAAELVLMGIKPTGPSEKYGYIMAESGDAGAVLQVRRFIEKPSAELARRLIQEGAHWNGGAFAFRLGYLMDIVRRQLEPTSFQDMLVRYGELEKTSFDYAVVEKAESVAMVPYGGKWADIGTWAALTEHMDVQATGIVQMGEGTEGTHAINELGLPMVVLGIKDAVVVATEAGILVCSKDESDYLKAYIDGIESECKIARIDCRTEG